MKQQMLVSACHLTPAEMKKLLIATNNPRDRCIVSHTLFTPVVIEGGEIKNGGDGTGAHPQREGIASMLAREGLRILAIFKPNQ